MQNESEDQHRTNDSKDNQPNEQNLSGFNNSSSNGNNDRPNNEHMRSDRRDYGDRRDRYGDRRDRYGDRMDRSDRYGGRMDRYGGRMDRGDRYGDDRRDRMSRDRYDDDRRDRMSRDRYGDDRRDRINRDRYDDDRRDRMSRDRYDDRRDRRSRDRYDDRRDHHDRYDRRRDDDGYDRYGQNSSRDYRQSTPSRDAYDYSRNESIYDCDTDYPKTYRHKDYVIVHPTKSGDKAHSDTKTGRADDKVYSETKTGRDDARTQKSGTSEELPRHFAYPEDVAGSTENEKNRKPKLENSSISVVESEIKAKPASPMTDEIMDEKKAAIKENESLIDSMQDRVDEFMDTAGNRLEETNDPTDILLLSGLSKHTRVEDLADILDTKTIVEGRYKIRLETSKKTGLCTGNGILKFECLNDSMDTIRLLENESIGGKPFTLRYGCFRSEE